MNTLRYKVIFSGRLAPDMTPEQVRTNLIDMCRFTPEALDRFFGGPTVVRSGVDRKAAWRCWELFRRAGALCVVEPLSGTPEHGGGAPFAAAEPKAICPRCRTTQGPTDTCQLCGLDMDI